MDNPTEKKYIYSESQEQAFGAGILLIVIWFIVVFSRSAILSEKYYIYSIPFRIAIAIWVYKISEKLNRNGGWAILGFLFPAITLIIIGRTKRKEA